MSLQYSVRRFLRTSTIWHWISIAAVVLFLFRYFRPKTPVNTYPSDFRTSASKEPDDGIDWTRFAYVQYVTKAEYLCNSLMMFEALERLGSKADRLLLYPSQWELYPERKTFTSVFLRKAQVDYKAHIVPVRAQHFQNGEATWGESFTKSWAFKQIQYDRVLSLSSDSTILKPLDDLFLLPSAKVGMPTAYWVGDDALSSAIMLIEPSLLEYDIVLDTMKNHTSEESDMEIVNELYTGKAMVLPSDLWLVSGELRRKNHDAYLAGGEIWNAERVLNNTKYVHFSDGTFPKPWFQSEYWQREQTWPKCETKVDGTEVCKEKEAWLWLYEDFKQRRLNICGEQFCQYLD